MINCQVNIYQIHSSYSKLIMKNLSLVFFYQCFLSSLNEVIQKLTSPLVQIFMTNGLFKIMLSKTL